MLVDEYRALPGPARGTNLSHLGHNVMHLWQELLRIIGYVGRLLHGRRLADKAR